MCAGDIVQGNTNYY